MDRRQACQPTIIAPAGTPQDETRISHARRIFGNSPPQPTPVWK